ncbi:MAG TPA: hypothetical protein VMU05_10385 [Dongiaceae bacterium]|nr:hypothetical protein [Dongiaceae bacterium]
MPRSSFVIFRVVLLLSLLPPGYAQEKRTTEAFDKYIADAEARLNQARSKPNMFTRIDSLPTGERQKVMSRLRAGEVVIDKQGKTPTEIPSGLIHDWVGTVLIPRVTIPQVLSLIQDYDHSSRNYSPDVQQSRLVSRNGDDFKVFMRLRKHKVVTVVLDTEYSVHYARLDASHQYSLSRSTRVSEIADAGAPKEHALAEGHDHGFMWRLNSYWAFEQVEDGVLIECEAISLTRDIPTGLGWMIGPFVNSIPRESLQFTLDATRKALNRQVAHKRPVILCAPCGEWVCSSWLTLFPVAVSPLL